jgi:hypothetical protein
MFAVLTMKKMFTNILVSNNRRRIFYYSYYHIDQIVFI